MKPKKILIHIKKIQKSKQKKYPLSIYSIYSTLKLSLSDRKQKNLEKFKKWMNDSRRIDTL